jgi:hypothetical protein
MNEQTKPTYPPGAWVFVSHSHKDLPEVTKVRNDLESQGFKPLLFFLKCLEDDAAELPDLLCREIKARRFFVLCESENSRSSVWVQKEVEIVRSLGRTYEVVNLDKEEHQSQEIIKRLARRSKVFVSSSHSDSEIASRIALRLRQEEYEVFDADSIPSGSSWADEIHSGISKAAKEGFVLLLLSKRAAESKWVATDLQEALALKGPVVPVMIEDVQIVFRSLPDHLRFMLQGLQFFNFTGRPFDVAMNEMLSMLRKRFIE